VIASNSAVAAALARSFATAMGDVRKKVEDVTRNAVTTGRKIFEKVDNQLASAAMVN